MNNEGDIHFLQDILMVYNYTSSWWCCVWLKFMTPWVMFNSWEWDNIDCVWFI